MSDCVQPNAPWTKCLVCHKPIKTCATPNGDPCPVHPDGVELRNRWWVCSAECWEIASDLFENPIFSQFAIEDIHGITKMGVG